MKNLKFKLILITSTLLTILVLILIASLNASASNCCSTCVGSRNCTACTDCSRCAHCNSGGSCGVCGGGWSPPVYNPSSNIVSEPKYQNTNTDFNAFLEKLSTNDLASETTWSSSSIETYQFYFQGNLVETTNEWSDDGPIVYYGNYAYLLKNFNNFHDGIKRKPYPLATWKATENSYSLFYDGNNISQNTTYEFVESDLVVYYENIAFYLENYKENQDGTLRIATETPSWKASKTGYSFFVDRQNVSNEISDEWDGANLVVYLDHNAFLLEDFESKRDGKLHFSKFLATWKKSTNGYYFYPPGARESVKTTNEFYGDNLLVFFGNSGFSLENYKKVSDNNFHFAKYIYTWKANEDGYSLFIDGKNVSSQTTNKWNGKNLIVTFNNQNFILKNYDLCKDNTIRCAIPNKQ